MNNNDKEAFKNWFEKNWQDSDDKDVFTEAWQAACLYKQKEIDNKQNLIDECEDRLKKSLHFLYDFEKLQAENAKLRKCVEFYADRDNWTPADDEYAWKVENKITGDDIDGYIPAGLSAEFDCGGKRARQVLKELEK